MRTQFCGCELLSARHGAGREAHAARTHLFARHQRVAELLQPHERAARRASQEARAARGVVRPDARELEGGGRHGRGLLDVALAPCAFRAAGRAVGGTFHGETPEVHIGTTPTVRQRVSFCADVNGCTYIKVEIYSTCS